MRKLFLYGARAYFHRMPHKISDAKREELLGDIRLVGQHKLMGYLPIKTITESCHASPKVLQKEAEAKGLKTLLLSEAESIMRSKNGEMRGWISSGALFVYDPSKLSDFLLCPENRAILEQNNWPGDADGFVRAAVNRFADNQETYDLLALAFGNPRYRFYEEYDGGPIIPALPFRPLTDSNLLEGQMGKLIIQ